MKKLFIFSLLCCFSNTLFATAYYSRNTAGLDLSNVANWTDAASGTGGTSPSNFTTAGNTFTVQNAASYLVSSSLTISGTGSSLTIGSGAAVTLTINAALTAPTITMSTASTVTANAAMSGALTMSGTASLTYNVSSGYPTFSSIASTTTVNFGGTAISHVIPAATYGNLTISSTGTSTFMNSAATSTWAVAGSLLFNSTGTVNVCNVSSGTANATLNVTGAFTISSTGTFNLNSSSGGTTNTLMAVTGTTSLSSTGTLNLNNCSNGTSYAKLTVTPAFTLSTAGFINVNKATGGTPSARLIFSNTYAQSAGTVTVGSATSGVTTTASDTISVAGATVTVTGGTINVGAGGATNNTNVFTATSATFSLSTGTVNIGSNSAGTGNNQFSVSVLTLTSGTFNGGAATGGTNTNTIVVSGAVSQSTTAVKLNSASAGTTTTIMTIGTTYGIISTGTLTIQGCSGGTNQYARMDVSGAFSMSSTGTITVNAATGSTNPSGRLRCLSKYTVSSGTTTIGSASSAAISATDTIDVADTVLISSTLSTSISSGTGVSSINRFICANKFIFSTGTFNMCNQTSGSSNNYLTINGSGGTVMTLTSGTFNGAIQSATSGTFNDTINITSATGDLSIATCAFGLNKPTSTSTSNATFIVGRNVTYTSTGSIALINGSNGTCVSLMTVGGNFSLPFGGTLTINGATGGVSPRAKMTVAGTFGLTTGTVRIGNVSSTATGTPIDTLAVTGNTTMSSGTFYVGSNNASSANNAFIETGTFSIAAGTLLINQNTGGSQTNNFIVNSTASPAFTNTGGTIYVAEPSGASTSTNKLTIAGGYSQTAGTLYSVYGLVSGTYNDTVNIGGTASISGGSFYGANGYGTAVVNFNNTSASCLTLSGASLVYLINSANAGNVTFTCAGSLTVSSTSTFDITFESASSAGVAVFQVNGNVTLNSASGYYVCWGYPSVAAAGNYMGITGNLSIAGAGNLYQYAVTTVPTGFVFNGSGTSASPQLLSYTTSAANSYGQLYNVNSGTYVKLQSNIALPTSASPQASLVQVNSGGTLDCSTYTISGGAGSGTSGLQMNGTLATANTAGINGSVTASPAVYASNANFIYNGSAAQVTGTSMPASFGSLTVNNSTGVTLSQSETMSGNLTFTSGKLNTSSYTLSMPGSSTVTGAGASSYVNGTLSKTISGLSTVNFETGDNDYAPVQLTLTGASAGSISVKSAYSDHPQMATSGIASSNYVNHYWTIGSSGVTLTSISPKFTYNLSDITGGSNANFITQQYASGVWQTTPYSTSNTTSPYSSTPSGISSSAFTGDYIFGLRKAPIPLTAAVGATVDNPFNITFTDDATWRSNITQVKVGSNVLPGAAYNVSTAGQITLDPSASVYLQTAGTFLITVIATNYVNDTVTQIIGAGVPTHLNIDTNPGDPTYSAGPFSPQPIVSIRDQYNNLTTSTATITAAVGSGSWTLGGTTSVAAVAGTTTFSGLTGTATSYVTGATMQFTSGALPTVTSTTFNVPAPSPTLIAASGATVDAPFNVTFTDDATWRAAITSIKIGASTLPPASYSISAGSIQFDPSLTALLQASGTFVISVIATTYGGDPVTQYIGPGVATHLAMQTDPVAPTTNPGAFVTQPVVKLFDQYNNLASTSSATVSAAATAGAFTLGGTTSIGTSGGLATYTDLTASASAYTPNVSITFSASGLTSVICDTFNIPYPYGTFTYGTGGTFPTLANAIATLNSVSFGGPIILNSNVNGWTETAPSGGYILGSSTMNPSLNSTNTLTINGYPGGANTVITAPVGTGGNDFIFAIAGADYVTINGINIQESASNTTATTKMEYGYAFFNLNSSGTIDGCQNDQVKNCTITLDKTNTNSTYGIASFHTTTSGASATPTATTDAHSNNKLYTNAISNCQYPIYLSGYNAGSPYSLYDQGNDVGGSSAATGNAATNWGATGSVSGPGAGVYLAYQNNANASYNTLNNASGGSANVNSLYGVYCSGTNATFTANHNAITLTEQSGSTSNTFNGIDAESSGTNLTASNNTITMSETAGSNVTTNGIYSSTSIGNNFTAKSNNISITMSISGGTNDLSGIYSNSIGVLLMQSNAVSITNSSVANNCITTFYRVTGGAGGTQTMNFNIATGAALNTANNLAAFGNTVNASNLKINNNNANLTTIATSCTIAVGIANSGSNAIQEMNNNNLTINASSLNTGTPAGVYNLGGASTSLDCNYDTITVTSNNAAAAGIYNGNTSTIPTGSFNYNVLNVNATSSGTAQIICIYNNNGLMTTQNMTYNTINANSYTGGGAVYGIATISGTVATANLNYNTITASTATGAVSGVYTAYDGSLLTPSINYNTIDLSMSGASAANIYYIYFNPSVAPATGGTQNINYNNFKSASGFPSNTGLLYFIANLNNIGSNNNMNYNYNTGTITKTGNGGSFYGIYSRGITLATGATSISYNSFNNINIGSGNAVTFWGIITGWNTGIPQNVSYNSFNNITCGTSPAMMIQASTYGSGSVFSYNTISNISAAGTGLYGLAISTVGSGGTGTVPGSSTQTSFGGTFQGNKMHDFSNSNASGIIYPFYYFYNTTLAASTFDFNQDTVYNMTVSGATSPGIYGLYQTMNASTYKLYSNVRNCVFHDFTSTNSSASPTINGVYFTWSDTNYIYNNNIYNFGTGPATGATTQVVGINLGTTAASSVYNVYNNSLTAFTTPASNNPNSIIGMYAQSATLNYWNLYHNTIAFGGLGIGTPGTAITSSSTNFGTAGILFPNISSSVLTLKNNIIYMNVNPTGTGISACIQHNVTGTAGTAPSSGLFIPNYNIYYTNSGASSGSSPKNYLYVDDITGGTGTPINGYAISGLSPSGTNNIVNDANLNSCAGATYGTSYKAFIGGGNESLTYTECNLTSSGFPTGTAGPSGESFAYHSGVAITSPSITTDLSGVTRATPPSRGANEFSGSAPSSGAPPVIVYTPILTTSYCIASPPSLSAAITSGAGINVTTGTKPRMYYKGSADANTLGATNDNTTNGWKYVEASNSSSPFTFQADYTKLFNTAAAGTTISYFVIAQDNSGTPLVGYNIVGLAAGYCPSSVALASGAFPVLASPTISSYTITALPTFTAAVAPTNFYGSSDNATLTISPTNSDLGIQWQMNYVGTSGSTGYNNISGATTNNYSAAMPGLSSTPPLASPGTTNNVSFQALLTCNSSVVYTTSPSSVTDYTPQVLSTRDSSRCGTGPVTLTATGSGGSTVYWYAAATGGSSLASGNSYSPTVSATTVFYAADSFGSYGNQSIGKADVLTTGTNGLYIISTGAAGDGLFFTVNKEVKISSVAIYPYTAGLSFTIAVYDASSSALLQSYSGTTTVSNSASPSTAQTVPVNFSLPIGNYKIAFSSLASTNYMWMNTFFTSYPFTVVPNTLSITGPQVSNYYEVFYNWQIASAVLSSPRVAVTATVNPLPIAGTIAATPASVCSGATTVLSETGTITPPTIGGILSSYTWSGPSGYTSGASASSVGNATLTPISGYYSLTVTYPGVGCTSNPVTTYVTVNPATTPTISGTYTACVAATQTLTATPTGGTWSTSDASVASVDPSTGIVTGVHAGAATITYVTPCSLSSTHAFTVNPTPTSITGPTTICVTSSYPTFTVACDGSSAGAWSSSPLSVAVIGSSSGTLTSMSVGSATITYTCTSGCSLTSPLTVSNTGPLSITGPSSVCVGNTISLADSTIGGTWSSSSSSIATVDPTGIVTGVSTGTVTISYVTGCIPHATASVTVNGASITLSNSGPICSGNNLTLTATPSTTLSSFTWTGPNSFNNTVSLTPTISSATTQAAGTYTFSATAGGCTNTATMAAVVGQTPTVTVTTSAGTICSGGTSTLNTTITPSLYSVYSIPYAPVSFTPTTTLTSASSWTSTYDDGYSAATLPFSFNFYGVNYSTVYINANGYITFGSGVSSGSSTPLALPSASAPSKMVALFWHDMNLSTGSITYGSTGTIPNRKFIISYNAVPDASDVNSGQIIMYEGSNVIDMMVSHTNAATKTCGVQNGSTLSALTAPGQNNAAYSVSGAGYQGWRFATPSYNYSWSPVTALSSTTAQNPVSSGLTATQVYTVSLYDIYSSCGSGATTTATVNVVPVPSVSLSASPGILCTGGNLTLLATPSGGTGTPTYTWSGPGIATTTGSTPTPGIFNPTVTTITTGSYSLTLSYTGSGCTTTNATSSSVTIATQPVVSILPSGTTLCTGDTLVLTETTVSGGIGTVTYTWSGPGIATTTGSSAISPSFVPTASTGAYSVAAAFSGSGCVTATANTSSVTVNTRPALSVGATPSICQGTTTTNISYSGATGSPTTYAIVWDATAHTAGFSDVSSASLSGGAIAVTVPAAAPGATYTGTLTVSNSFCTSPGYTISVNVVQYPTAAITSAIAPCSGHTTNITFTGTAGAIISYMVDSGSILTATLTGGTYNLVTPALTSPNNYTLIDVTSSPCTTPVDTVAYITPGIMQWVGATSSDWNTASNWSCGFVPTSVDNVTIDTGTTFAPDIAASASGTTKSLTITPNVTVNINSGATLNVTGDLTNNGTVTGTGMIDMNGSSAQSISGLGLVNNLDLNNSAGATIATGSRLTIKSALSVTAGTLITNDSLVLYSDTSATARVASLPPSGSLITGNVKVMQYIPGGMRRFRFISHPFNNYIPLSQIEDYIDITGSGGISNGFTTTASNAPSAFRYDPTVGNSSLPYDIGWRPFASTGTAVDSNRFHKYQGIRMMFRGAKGEGLGYIPYTPSQATYAVSGVVNQGPQVVVMSRGSDTLQQYNMVGNPYPSPVDIGTVLFNARAAGNIFGAGYFVWNPYLGAAGQFQHIFFGGSATPYYLQQNCAFQVQAAHNGDTLNFTESNKGAAASFPLLKVMPEYTSLMVYDANYHPWDMLYLQFNDKASDNTDKMEDASKPSGADFNFYSISADHNKLAVDARPYNEGKVIPLGINSGYAQDFIIKAENVIIPTGGSLYLHDKLLKQYVLLKQGTEYRFSITSDKATQGENRFELGMSTAFVQGKGLQVNIVPNPATDDVNISYVNGKFENVAVRIMDLSGVSVFNKDLGFRQNGSIMVSLGGFAPGIYMVELTSSSQKVVERLVKE